MSLAIACIGEAMIEFAATRAPQKLGVAGDALNTAVYLRRSLPPEHSVSFISVVGQDPLSAQITDFVRSENILPKMEHHPSKLPGLYAIKTDANGERSFYFWRENSAARTLFSNGFGQLEGFDVIHLSAVTLAILPADIRQKLLNWLQEWPGLVSFDSNYRPALWQNRGEAQASIRRAFQICDIALPSLDDEMALFDDKDETQVRARLLGYGITQGALKRGANGPVDLGKHPSQTYPKAGRVVDTTAAGDSFNGGYLACLLTGGSAKDAMMAGHVLALDVIAHKGAITPNSNKKSEI